MSKEQRNGCGRFYQTFIPCMRIKGEREESQVSFLCVPRFLLRKIVYILAVAKKEGVGRSKGHFWTTDRS